MKKYFVSFLILFSVPAFAAPSVRALGNVSAPVSVGTNTNKATPVRAASTKLSANTGSLSRVGSVRPASSVPVTGAITGSMSSRVPIIPVKAYSVAAGNKSTNTTITTPQETPSGSCCNVDVDAIIQAITQNYYDKTEVYNNNEFTDAVTSIVQDIVSDQAEDPKIDAVRVVGTANNRKPAEVWTEKGVSLPTDYVYIWIEE